MLTPEKAHSTLSDTSQPYNWLAGSQRLSVEQEDANFAAMTTTPTDQRDENLTALRVAVASTTTLKTILDDEWFDGIERNVSTGVRPADPTGLLYDFSHILRGVPWFERDQALDLAGRSDEINEDGKFALWLAGRDPLRTILPDVEARLTAFAGLPFKAKIVAEKLAQLRTSRGGPAFKNHLFEIGVLGDLALRGVLVDIEEPTTNVDGVINIDGREILIEATNTVQRVIPDTGAGVFSADPNIEIDQVVNKVRKKVADGRQFAKAEGKPTVLFLARTYFGAGREMAQVALNEVFASSMFAPLSGVVLADSYRLHATSWHQGRTPDAQLTTKEAQQLKEWYGGPA